MYRIVPQLVLSLAMSLPCSIHAQINNPPTGSGSGTVNANSGSAGAVTFYPAAGGSTTVGPDALLTDSGTSLTYTGTGGIISTTSGGLAAGANGGAAGTIILSGSTSGTATVTAPAVAGTRTNQVAFTNVSGGPNGTASNPTYSFTAAPSAGMYLTNNTNLTFSVASGKLFDVNSTAGLSQFTASGICFTAAADATTACDTGISRLAAGVMAVGNGTPANTTGVVKTAAYMSVGTTFTSNAGCTDTVLTGGATAGKLTIGQSTICTTVITMGNSATSPTGWMCDGVDLQHPAVLIQETATSTTTASLTTSAAPTSTDTLVFKCIGF
jgi:hypothetical protein